MRRGGEGVANPRHCTEGVGSRSQVSQLAQPLKGDPLLLQWVVLGIGQTVDDEVDGPQLDPLAGTGRFDQFPGGRNRRTDMQTAAPRTRSWAENRRRSPANRRSSSRRSVRGTRSPLLSRAVSVPTRQPSRWHRSRCVSRTCLMSSRFIKASCHIVVSGHDRRSGPGFDRTRASRTATGAPEAWAAPAGPQAVT